MAVSLNVLTTSSAPSNEALARYFHNTESRWTEHISQSSTLDFGSAWCSPQLPRVYEANRMLDVALPDGMQPAEALRQAEAHFAECGSFPWQWIMNTSAKPEQINPMAAHLLSLGYAESIDQIMYLDRLPKSPIPESDLPLSIIPARASFRHARILQEQGATRQTEPQRVEAALLHLDDPHYEALLAMLEGQPVGYIGVLAAGEVGRIEELFVTAPFRGKRIGATLVSRALEICARSLFKHILLSVQPNNSIAIHLYEKFGFRAIGQMVAYQRPLP